ncbi:Uncharacterised protein [Bordetella pertussis]|nr:Uncharacterised protein [Bordetella pertussis]CFO78299.1 Uncharacterised protein [Bordetella pertussis]CFW33893.1 Uncharacterised protein [Bordetella pertussis]CPK52925.1 Uncharacterised protein [Bordetella pertussis]CPM23345.1 Uncharacterised protein [Bordetella pertussis]
MAWRLPFSMSSKWVLARMMTRPRPVRYPSRTPVMP